MTGLVTERRVSGLLLMSQKTDDEASAVSQGGDGDEGGRIPVSSGPSAVMAWERDLTLFAEAGRQVMVELQDASGLSQDRTAEVIRGLIPARVKRGMTGATLSRYNSDAEHFWHVPFLVLISMLRAYRVDLRDYVQRVYGRMLVMRYGAGDVTALGAQLAMETETARLRERSEQDQRLLDAFHLLTPAQRADKLVELNTLAARNQEYRASTITEGYPVASDADVEIGGGLMGALTETDEWADRLRQERKDRQTRRRRGGDTPAS